MRNLIAASAAFLLSTTAATAGWNAFAINDYAYGSGYATTDQQARVRAIDDCKRNARNNVECHRMVTSMEDHEYLVVIRCDGIGATGGSKYDFQTAIVVAARKIGYGNALHRCNVLGSR